MNVSSNVLISNTIWGHLGAEFSDVLMVLRRGSTPLMFTTVAVLHGIVISFSLAVMVAVLIRKTRVLLLIVLKITFNIHGKI